MTDRKQHHRKGIKTLLKLLIQALHTSPYHTQSEIEMKLDANIYTEAQRAARFPRLSLLMLGVICGAMVPAMYMRSHLLPRFRKEDLQDVRAVTSGSGEAGVPKPHMKLWPMLNAQQRREVVLASAPNKGLENDQGLDSDGSLTMFSSIM